MGFTDLLRESFNESVGKTQALAEQNEYIQKHRSLCMIATMLYCSEGGDFDSCVNRAFTLYEKVEDKLDTAAEYTSVYKED